LHVTRGACRIDVRPELAPRLSCAHHVAERLERPGGDGAYFLDGVLGVVVEHLADEQLGQRRMAEHEAHVRLGEATDGLRRARGRAHVLHPLVGEGLEAAPDGGAIGALLAPEVVGEQGRIHPGGGADLLDGAAVVALPREQRFGGVEDDVGGAVGGREATGHGA
jgi:hypothetical protein